ncbi:unnamed protein product [Acanthoscelides obtectus]|uniref:Uncharacterized protein n=1 Tax=Acanthoscelides obtectus TaxID=200917 RepID=A0A9P0PRC0_ACAOB|nr:unnamed protein product [Acanthoscelides obtectus]CAK1663312.1 hypothetical protein AOBTE_LOCUS23606 [Acanthoscelides obtectus]
MTLKSKCPDEEYFTVLGSTLVEVPVNCNIEYQDYRFGNRQQKAIGKPLVLPSIAKNSSVELANLKLRPLKSGKIPLEDMHEIPKHIQTTNQLVMEDMKPIDQSNWSLWLTITVILAVVAVLTSIKFLKKKLKKHRKPQQAAPPGFAEETAVASARVFQSEVTATSMIKEEVGGFKPQGVVGYVGITKPKNPIKPNNLNKK